MPRRKLTSEERAERRKAAWDPKSRPYGCNVGSRGNDDVWRAAFGESMSPENACEFLGDSSPYVVLGLHLGASGSDIKSAYRRLALKHHPDRGGDASKFKMIHAAYVALGSPR